MSKLTKTTQLRKALMYSDDKLAVIINKTVEALNPEKEAEGLLRFYLNEMASNATSTSDFNMRLQRFLESSRR